MNKIFEEISLRDFKRVLISEKRLVLSIIGTVAAISILYALLSPKIYEGRTSIVPVGNSKGGLSSLASQLSGLTGISGLGSMANNSSSQGIFAILGSRSVAELIIKKLNLCEAFYKTTLPDEAGYRREHLLEKAVEQLRGRVKIFEDIKDGTVNIVFQDHDPQLAAAVVNEYLIALQKIIDEEAFTSAKRNRIFIEKQLSESRQNLLKLGQRINSFYNNKERNFSKLESLSTDSSIFSEDGMEVFNKDIGLISPQNYLEYLTLQKNSLVQVNGLLLQQYEMAKIEETKEDLAFQIIDKARPSTIPVKPRRRLIVVSSVMSAFFFSTFLALYRSMKRKPQLLS